MKKKAILILSLIMILSFTMLSACGGGGSEDVSDSKYIGTWKVDSMSIADESEDVEEEIIMVINGDGTGTMTTNGEVSEFTWSPTDEGFKTKGDIKAKFKDEDGGIVSKVLGVEMHFVRAD